MKALLIQSLMLFMATVSTAATPDIYSEDVAGGIYADSHEIAQEITGVALTATQRNMIHKDSPLYARMINHAAKEFCGSQKFADVAVTSDGRRMFRVAPVARQAIPLDRPLLAVNADGVRDIALDRATGWKTVNNYENKTYEHMSFGPAVVFTHLRCTNRIK